MLTKILTEDEDIVLAAVTQNGLALKFAADPLQAQQNIIEAALNQTPWAFAYVKGNIRRDDKCVKNLLRQDARLVKCIDDDIAANLIIIKPGFYELANEGAKNIVNDHNLFWQKMIFGTKPPSIDFFDKKTMEKLIIDAPKLLEHAPNFTKRNERLVLSLVEKDGLVLEHVHPSLLSKLNILSAAYQNNQESLKFIPEKFQGKVKALAKENPKEMLPQALSQSNAAASLSSKSKQIQSPQEVIDNTKQPSLPIAAKPKRQNDSDNTISSASSFQTRNIRQKK